MNKLTRRSSSSASSVRGLIRRICVGGVSRRHFS